MAAVTIQAQAQLQAQSLAQAQAEAVVQAKAVDSPSPTHRKVVQSEVPVLEPVNLPPVHHHKPLTRTTSAPSSEYNELNDDDDIDIKLDEPSEFLQFLVHCTCQYLTVPFCGEHRTLRVVCRCLHRLPEKFWSIVVKDQRLFTFFVYFFNHIKGFWTKVEQ